MSIIIVPFDPYFGHQSRVNNPEANQAWDDLMKMEYEEQKKIIDAIWAKPPEQRTPTEGKLKRRWGIRKVQAGKRRNYFYGVDLKAGGVGPRVYFGYGTT